ncbi:hypothetical protein FRC12_003680 [Ceratobasidium sp. 428]|nr:hypothetical protein FRC12_003680 [Ceratobasidium sp. 428]
MQYKLFCAPVRIATKSKAGQANETQTQREVIDNTAVCYQKASRAARAKVPGSTQNAPESEIKASSTTNETTPTPISAPTPMPAPSSSLTTATSNSTQAGSSKAAPQRKKAVVQPSERSLRSCK